MVSSQDTIVPVTTEVGVIHTIYPGSSCPTYRDEDPTNEAVPDSRL